MKKKLIAALLALSMTSTMFMGCGSNGEDSQIENELNSGEMESISEESNSESAEDTKEEEDTESEVETPDIDITYHGEQ